MALPQSVPNPITDTARPTHHRLVVLWVLPGFFACTWKTARSLRIIAAEIPWAPRIHCSGLYLGSLREKYDAERALSVLRVLGSCRRELAVALLLQRYPAQLISSIPAEFNVLPLTEKTENNPMLNARGMQEEKYRTKMRARTCTQYAHTINAANYSIATP
ncbi:hypothetical protein B0H17DRAFT_1187337 [Mycena rosella]|uniref:Uncharacterized protein n=1 Tax=Mycena rosella TaxID=1033263 RepID=A0AAD7C371_MYCRO|nr:hypothetical protein B0H17DRAFT_1187337 [Mycena rosella]